MWRQYAQPLSCEARIWTSSTSAGSRCSRAAASRPIRALNAFGALLAKFSRGVVGAGVLVRRHASNLEVRMTGCRVQFHGRNTGQFLGCGAGPGRGTGTGRENRDRTRNRDRIRNRTRTRNRRASGAAEVLGQDLHVELAAAGGRRTVLMDALREAVRSGRLAPGTRLPPYRSLAADLGIARNTVAEAYGELVAEGWLTARQGSGTRVAGRAESRSRPAAPDGSRAGTGGTRPSHAQPPAGPAGGRLLPARPLAGLGAAGGERRAQRRRSGRATRGAASSCAAP